MADAVFNVAHASLLVLGLAQGRLDLVARGLADRLHQPRRAALYPESMALLARAPGVRRARRLDLGRRADGAGVEPVRRDGGCGRAAARRDGRVGRRAAGAVRAAGRGRAGADLGPDEHRRPGRHAAHQPPHVAAGRARMQPSEAALPTVHRFGVAWIARRSPPGQPGDQLRLVAGEREQAAAVGRRRIAGVQLVGDREAAGRRLGARPPDGDGERADRAAVAAQRQPPRGAVDVDREVRCSPAARGPPGSSPRGRWGARSRARAASRRAARSRSARAASRTRSACRASAAGGRRAWPAAA